MNIAKKILIDELIEGGHIERVEDVIFWALEHYLNRGVAKTNGELVAYSIIERIKECERKEEANLMNPELIDSLNL